ncbi:interferon-stimulated gene 20 kDa protein-like [Dysidea avara]|uniref:interferon-stimulated gene 20 kDa protein-like n=1 Tax=Dysidea avara TaxID=196820 RepID=UPI00332421AD
MPRKKPEVNRDVDESLHHVRLLPRTKVTKKAHKTDDSNHKITPTVTAVVNMSGTFTRRAKTVALDCEMVGVGDKKSSALARCTIVNYNGEVIYNSYIKPNQCVTDYRTPWSGIRPWHLKTAVPHQVALSDIKKILSSKIIVGHDLSNDFNVLGFSLPSHQRRDTAKYRNLRRLAGLCCQPSLKVLAHRLLGRRIQKGSHCSLEDARATLDIYKLMEQEWESEFQESSLNFFNDSFWPDDILNT